MDKTMKPVSVWEGPKSPPGPQRPFGSSERETRLCQERGSLLGRGSFRLGHRRTSHLHHRSWAARESFQGCIMGVLGQSKGQRAARLELDRSSTAACKIMSSKLALHVGIRGCQHERIHQGVTSPGSHGMPRRDPPPACRMC